MISYLKALFAERAASLDGDGGGYAGADMEDKVRLGMALFLVSLAVLFIAGMVAYLIIRTGSPSAPPMGSIDMPMGLWLSTAILLSAGFTMYNAQRRARQGEIPSLRMWLKLTFALSVAFVLVQVPSMNELMVAHRLALVERFSGIYGLTVSLIAIHALHVIGGLIPLTLLTWWAVRGEIGMEHELLVRSCGKYWHFLEGVWVVMFGVFLIVR
jgi:cytochrome c oxidase subunit 3